MARWLVVALAAVAIAGATMVVASRGRSIGRAAVQRVVAPRAQSPDVVELAAVDRRTATRIAWRFASVYTRWDAGDRDGGTARRLAATATRNVLAELSRPIARPVAGSARPLRLAVTAANRIADGYAVALGRRGVPGSQVITVMVVATPRGPRVDRLER